MVRTRTSASKKRVLKLSNFKNAEFLLEEVPGLKRSSRSGILEPERKECSLGNKIQTNDKFSSSKLSPYPEYSKRITTGQTGVKSQERCPPFGSKVGTSKSLKFKTDQTGLPCATISRNPSSGKPTTSKLAPATECTNLSSGDCEEISSHSDIQSDMYGFSDDDDKELDETVEGLTSSQPTTINSACSCGLAVEVANQQTENLKSRKQIMFLKKRIKNLEWSHGRLQQALLSKLLPLTHKPFENIDRLPDCPSANMILKMSTEAKDSDYIFVKLLMFAVWPEGFVGRSVTGRTSNNPKGRAKQNQQPIGDDPADDANHTIPVRTALETNKVKFVNDCLRERRLLLHDDDLVAKKVASNCNRLMQTVISNFNRYRSN